nr:hypothetical protein [Blastococcus sp. TML/M2B]
MSTDPAGMTAAVVSSSVAVRPASQRWLPGTNRVAPFSTVKSSSGHIVLTTTSVPVRGSG